jgi:ATP-dependent 26S proteasome regulatory subunit
MAQKTVDELRLLLRAQYPMIYMVTYEEARATQMLAQLCQERGMDLHTWSFTEGIKRFGNANPPEEANPVQVLDFVREYDRPSMFVLRDMHAYFGSPEVVRKLRDLQNDASNSYKPIVMTSPILRIPPELEKVVTVVDLDLPDTEEIGEVVDTCLNLVGDTSQSCDRTHVVQACRGLTSDEINNVLAKSWVAHSTLDVPTILSEKRQIIRKSGILEYCDEIEDYENIGGMDLLKQWLEDRGDAFSPEARHFGLPQPKGILLLGTPGSGKSLIAKSVAGLWGMPLLRLDVGKIFAGIVGASEENMRRVIKVTESVAPVVLMIDEIEKGLSGTGSSNFSDAGTTSRVFGTLIQWMNDKTAPVFIIATANDVRQLPPELLRKGRFDEVFFVTLPTAAERAEIFGIHIAKPREQHQGRSFDGFDLEELATCTDNFSGAEIEQAVISGLFKAFKDHSELTQEHILAAIEETVPLATTMREQIDFLHNWARNRARYASSGGLRAAEQAITTASTFGIAPSKIKVVRSRRSDSLGR